MRPTLVPAKGRSRSPVDSGEVRRATDSDPGKYSLAESDVRSSEVAYKRGAAYLAYSRRSGNLRNLKSLESMSSSSLIHARAAVGSYNGPSSYSEASVSRLLAVSRESEGSTLLSVSYYCVSHMSYNLHS